VIVTNDSPVFGSAPYTEQSRGCGQPGDRLLLPQSFLAAWNATANAWGSPGRLFVREWAKLRYGIFDEQGFAGDPLYPNFYKFQDRVLPTGTSNAVVLGMKLWCSLLG
jgi:calcium-activated chloride channel regulator 4